MVTIVPNKPKKVIIKVTPYSGKPVNGGKKQPSEEPPKPIPKQNLKRNLFSRCLDVIREDIQEKVLRTKATVKDPNEDWDRYKQFLELAKGKE